MIAKNESLRDVARGLLERAPAESRGATPEQRVLAVLVGVDLLEGFVAAAGRLQPPHPPDAAACLYLEQLRATDGEAVWGIVRRAPTSPASARMFVATLLDLLPPRPLPRRPSTAGWRMAWVYAGAALRFRSLPLSVGAKPLSWRSFDRWRVRPEFGAAAATFLEDFRRRADDPDTLADAAPRFGGDADSDDPTRGSTSAAYRFEALVFALFALEWAAALEAASRDGEAPPGASQLLGALRARLAGDARADGALSPIEEVADRMPLFATVWRNWMTHPRAAASMLLEFAPRRA